MIDLTKLPPTEMARHLGNPDGEIGLAVGERINGVNRNIIFETYHRLNLGAGMAVMEIGFANGHLVPDLMRHASGLRYHGIDISQTMVDEARRFNAVLIPPGQARFDLASAEAIPAADGSLDRVFAVNVIYFWPDPVPPLREIRRVLRPSGFSLIAAVTPETVTGNEVFQVSNGFHIRDAGALVAAHRAAGFRSIDVEEVSEVVERADGTPWTRYYTMVRGSP